MRHKLLGCLLILLGLVALIGSHADHASAGDTGWAITRFDAFISIEADGELEIVESIDVDFAGLERHGIFREIPVEYEYKPQPEKRRHYDLDVMSITNAEGEPWPYERSFHGANVQLKIGDPDRTVSGRQNYRITYRVRGVLNPFEEHDELYWNVNGFEWPVLTERVSATVVIAGGGIVEIACYEGAERSAAPCVSELAQAGDSATFITTGALPSGENLTIVAAIAKGRISPEPLPILVDAPRNWWERNFPPSPWSIAAAVVTLLAGSALIVAGWWRHGRDRVYRSMYYLSRNTEERTRPMFYRDEVVVEYTPPDDLRPAQMGLLLDERADTRDVTATIIDLAVRGYLKIEEKEKGWIFGSKDWHLTRLKEADSGLLAFEATVLKGLFEDGNEVDLSDLKNEFYKDLAEAQEELYADSMEHRWFARDPSASRNWIAAAGIGVAALGGVLVWLLGEAIDAAVLGVPIAGLGLLLLLTGSSMSKRTAAGSEALRRTLGFRLFIETADKRRQEFNERANIFAEYLPYAIVFGSVDKWARAFRDIDTQPSTASWYTGAAAFSAADFSRGLESFSSSVSGVIASTPGGSGGSGFSGGASGGGGGGGGGGSW